MGQLTKFFSLSGREKKLVFEASFLLSLSSLCIKVIAFKHIEQFLRSRWRDCAWGGFGREAEIGLVKQSVLRAANGLPWASLCLSRSIAEFIMLRRRGVHAVLFAGARILDRSSLEAHAWVDTSQAVKDMSSKRDDFTTVIRID
jgi:Transglutaminase-like superfamily